ncbi:hypothetical protein ACQKNC_20935 [Lysinibacillus sp. NPDC094177]|uniref:hypothetical protein n=1 Tax=Lysinibacillus sp. NPDC094177 TaxID=3390580 RepID=UPI003D05E27F
MRKRSANVATATTVFVCAKAKRQRQREIGHDAVIAGRSFTGYSRGSDSKK